MITRDRAQFSLQNEHVSSPQTARESSTQGRARYLNNLFPVSQHVHRYWRPSTSRRLGVTVVLLFCSSSPKCTYHEHDGTGGSLLGAVDARYGWLRCCLPLARQGCVTRMNWHSDVHSRGERTGILVRGSQTGTVLHPGLPASPPGAAWEIMLGWFTSPAMYRLQAVKS